MASNILLQVPRKIWNSDSKVTNAQQRSNPSSSQSFTTKLSCFHSLLPSCATLKQPRCEAKQIHAQIIVTGLYPRHQVLQAIFGSYVKSGDLSSARSLFDEMPVKNTYVWNLMIQAYSDNGDSLSVVLLYRNMLVDGACADQFTLPCVLMSCVSLDGGVSLGKQIHGHVFKLGLHSDVYVGNSLMNMYGDFKMFGDARNVFGCLPLRNVACWTTLGRLHVAEGRPRLAIEVFHQMELEGWEFDPVAAITMLGACRQLGSAYNGRKVHEHIRRTGLESDLRVGNSLVTMYIDCDSLDDARAAFDQIKFKNVVSWTTMLGGYIKNGSFNEGLKLFMEMQLEGIRPDALSISSVLPACGRITACTNGQEIHCYAIKNGFDAQLALKNAVIDMYVKSGRIDYASKVFSTMATKDVVSWTVMIAGYSLHGQGELGIELFQEMKNTNVQPDQITYTAVLCACCVARRVEEGLHYFKCIATPKVEHWACVVYLLSCAGKFGEAQAFIQDARIGKYASVQRALLNGCRIHGKKQLGRCIAELLTELETDHADNYVLLSNMYAAMGKTQYEYKYRKMITDLGLKTRKACSWIKIRNKVHAFGVGDVSHPRSERIYWELQSLMKKMEGTGYKRKSDFSFHDADEERETILVGHSEMLAIGFGLISTSEGVTIRITKNHRVCADCHAAAKMMSKILNREIVLKDPQCFHHFVDGSCSCSDFW
ncbi:pentatricopeptide repeat-containing protein At1g15510, chloroplastic-like [Nymphaea colorata]|nr:pentatricopeptide repeat-containing protein At1g15510, chloroplastic-like [Nymphaea colorata]